MTSHEHSSSLAISFRILSRVVSPSAEKNASNSRKVRSSISLVLDRSCAIRSMGVQEESTRPRFTRRLTLAWAMAELTFTNKGNSY